MNRRFNAGGNKKRADKGSSNADGKRRSRTSSGGEKVFKKSASNTRTEKSERGFGEKRPKSIKPGSKPNDKVKYERKSLEERQLDKRNFIKEKFEKSKKIAKPAETPDYDLDTLKKITKKDNNGIRLNRYIANCGVCSRRDADLLIQAGEIKVNGEPVTEMGFIVQEGDVVKYGNRTLKREKLVYVLLNKPKDFITTTNDPDERKTVMDLVAGAAKERLYPVGRLDRNTTGLLILTNDGELAEKLAHPSNKVRKIYEVSLDRPLEEKDYDRIVKGVHLEDGLAVVDELAILSPDRQNLGLEIHIGRNRIVRRIFEYLGYNVEKLDRVMYAHLTKKDLPRGNWRYLTEKEVLTLKLQNRKAK